MDIHRRGFLLTVNPTRIQGLPLMPEFIGASHKDGASSNRLKYSSVTASLGQPPF
jgi:hypothetical protein